jgi:signal transduction histidine kinase
MGHALAREKELSEMKSSFVSMVSHEFRTPLEVILSATDILDRYLDRLEPADRRQHLDSIQESVHRMTAMMEEVLLLGRFEAGRFHFQPDDLHLASWSRRFADEMRSATSGRGVIELVLGDFEPMVWADEKLLRHILANLVSNAVKYSAPGSTAHLNIVRDGRDAVFRVEDHGCGIPVADQTRLFEAFHRGRNVNQVPGTGLGLVIVKRAVALHGGRIEFTSEEGQGTTFTVRLPLFAETDSTNRNSP